ncbi:MAG: EpsI family protein [Bryobacterales bacterium]|nr:EpsI family protein [Bryobacterales bacterium]
MGLGKQLTSLFTSKRMIVLTVVLIAQMAILYGYSRDEDVPLVPPLSTLPTEFPGWTMIRESKVEDEVLAVLRADDTLTRVYSNGQDIASLFIAYFKTQRTGQAPHSPKHCLPGSGWTPSESGFLDIPLPGENRTIKVNRYVVTRGEDSSIVLYWYQSLDRVVASEYWAKVYLVTDSIRFNRTDTALVRVVVPIPRTPDGVASAEKVGVSFIQKMFPSVGVFFPPAS